MHLQRFLGEDGSTIDLDCSDRSLHIYGLAAGEIWASPSLALYEIVGVSGGKIYARSLDEEYVVALPARAAEELEAKGWSKVPQDVLESALTVLEPSDFDASDKALAPFGLQARSTLKNAEGVHAHILGIKDGMLWIAFTDRKGTRRYSPIATRAEEVAAAGWMRSV